MLAPHASGVNPRDGCKVILSAVSGQLTPGHYCLGLTKVFLRDEQSGKLDELRNQMLAKSVLLLQKTWRGYYYKSRYRRLKQGATRAQSRMIISISLFCPYKPKQKLPGFRGRRQRVQYDRIREAAITLEACMLYSHTAQHPTN